MDVNQIMINRTLNHIKSIDCGYGYKVVCRDDDIVNQFRYRENAVYKFMEKMLKLNGVKKWKTNISIKI